MAKERRRGIHHKLLAFSSFALLHQQRSILPEVTTFEVIDSIDLETQVRLAWDKHGDRYLAQETLDAQAATMHMLLDTIEKPKRRERWLSLGSGPGLYEVFLLQQWRRASIVSLDLSSVLLKKQRKIVSQVATQSIDVSRRIFLVNGSMTRLPLGGRGYDRILSINSLHWTPRWKEAITEMNRVLSPRSGSRIYVVVSSAPLFTDGRRGQIAEGLDEDSLLDEFESHGLRAGVVGRLQIGRAQFEQPTKRLYCVFERGSFARGHWSSRIKDGQLSTVDYETANGKVNRIEYQQK